MRKGLWEREMGGYESTLKKRGAWPVRVKGAAEGCQLRDMVLIAQ